MIHNAPVPLLNIYFQFDFNELIIQTISNLLKYTGSNVMESKLKDS